MSRSPRLDEPAPTTSGQGDRSRPIPPKWAVLGVFWIAQAPLVYLLGAVWISLAASVRPDAIFGSIDSFDEFLSVLGDRGMMLVMSVFILGITALQAVLLLPVRRPAAVRQRGASLWASIGVVGLAAGGVWIGAALGVVSLIMLARTGDTQWLGTVVDHLDARPWAVFVPLLAAWAVATPLLVAFCRTGPRETVLARLATRILQGTALEVVAIIPLDIMIRRRTDCYCNSGTFWSLTLCATVGVLLGGPAVFYTLLCQRRRRWYAGRCEACGYDMSGLRSADRCPECGCGWAPSQGEAKSENGAASPPPK